jgi:hypothetical protein
VPLSLMRNLSRGAEEGEGASSARRAEDWVISGSASVIQFKDEIACSLLIAAEMIKLIVHPWEMLSTGCNQSKSVREDHLIHPQRNRCRQASPTAPRRLHSGSLRTYRTAQRSDYRYATSSI